LIKNEDKRNAAYEWLMLTGNRWVIVGIGMISVFSLTIILGLLGYIGVAKAQLISTMFSTTIAGLFAFVPLMLSLISVAILNVFGGNTFTNLYGEFDNLNDFRQAIAALSPNVVVNPTEPEKLVSVVADIILDRANKSLEVVQENSQIDREFEEQIYDVIESTEYLTDLSYDNITFFRLIHLLSDTDYREFGIRMRRIRLEHEDVLSGAADELLAELTEILRYTIIMRQYMIAVYFQRNLGKVSRYIGFSGAAALTASIFVILIYAGHPPELAYGITFLILVGFGVSLVFLPFFILVSFMARIATMVRRAASPGLFGFEDNRTSFQMSSVSNYASQTTVDRSDTNEQNASDTNERSND
jgi:Na+-transporting methylmalonyl-CoA/oxaloacetate decarboxylase gamma subunit